MRYLRCAGAILYRETLRFVHQKSRLLSSLVRPLVWLLIFAAGFRSVLGVSVIPPYETYILYEVYITPGLLAMIQLFGGMQNALSMVYDRDLGSMKTLLAAPFPRWYLLFCRLTASAIITTFQVYLFLGIAWFFDIQPPPAGYVMLLPAVFITGMALGSLGLLISSFIKRLENFAGMMNFVIFPMFFTSSALYPLWKIEESSDLLYRIAAVNPFTHAVELIRFSLYNQPAALHTAVTLAVFAGCFLLSAFAYSPSFAFNRKSA